MLYGIASHAIFVVAVTFMVIALYNGLRIGRGPFHGTWAWLANTLLIVQFPLLHSYLLSAGGRKILARLAPADLGQDLAPTTFALISSLQVLATFALWSPSGIVLDEANGAWLWLFRASFAGSWLFLIKALNDAGLELQTGFVGWSSVLRGKRPEFGEFPTHGLFRLCRQPVYLGFALTLWTGPVHTLDGLVLALTWTTYCIAGPLHKELRYLGWYGERFSRYRASVPYILPRLRS
ncbi:MAG: isoprenylcysteine carboxylmethyltransferase family protein [Planctomycetes bacterium]|nr:isoprenylcysteine carboxylmethyltransferase family protein [Planctomycetota bacterium]